MFVEIKDSNETNVEVPWRSGNRSLIELGMDRANEIEEIGF